MAQKDEFFVCDAHMHCWDQLEKVTTFNNHILGDCGTYLPADYREDLVLPEDFKLRSCVHVEAFPDDQVKETQWIDSLVSADFPLTAIVANANISLQKENEKSWSTQVEGMEALIDVLNRHKAASGLVKGIRWVLNHEPNWPQVHRCDYFQDPQFRAGFAKLEEHGLSFDLQCNPHQLEQAAAFLKDFPNVPVVLNHIGSLKLEGDAEEQGRSLEVWRAGMRAMAALPHAMCKLSMLAYTVKEWWASEEGKALAKQVVMETIGFFGPERCMFASNFPAEDQPCRKVLYGLFKEMISDMPADQQRGLLCHNAERFYRISSFSPPPRQMEHPPARIAVIGAAWWAQGWHMPQLDRNPDSKLAAIMQRSEQPQAAAFLNLKLKTKTELKEIYKGVPIFSSCDEMLKDEAAMANIDGVIICTAHSCHADMGMKFLAAGKHVLMEKPMTVDVPEARTIAAAADKALTDQGIAFMVNSTANYRAKSFDARRLIEEGELGEVSHVLAVMYSPLMFLFDDPANDGWVKATGSQLQPDGSGNGFGYGQLSHLLAWVLAVAQVEVDEVTAITHRSERSGADLMDAALIRCKGNKSISLSGGCGWPGNEHGEEATGKHFDIKIFGTKGVLMYGGDDKKFSSGRLELRKHDGSESYISEGFLMENTEAEGMGPESLLEFIKACRGLPYKNGADQHNGLETVRVLDAMYRSAASGKTEKAK